MQMGSLKRFIPALALVALVTTACSGCSGDDASGSQAPSPSGAGIQQGLSLASLTGAGWRICYEDAYSTPDTPIADVLAACAGTHMMLACRSSSATDALTLAAADLRTVVTQADANGATSHHVANGVGWYYSTTQSWGFFPAGQPVNRGPCDSETTASGDRRLCWHVLEGALQNGYRCGANDLSLDGSWRRLVLVHD